MEAAAVAAEQAPHPTARLVRHDDTFVTQSWLDEGEHAARLCCGPVTPACLLHKRLEFHLFGSTVCVQALTVQRPPLHLQTGATLKPSVLPP